MLMLLWPSCSSVKSVQAVRARRAATERIAGESIRRGPRASSQLAHERTAHAGEQLAHELPGDPGACCTRPPLGEARAPVAPAAVAPLLYDFGLVDRQKPDKPYSVLRTYGPIPTRLGSRNRPGPWTRSWARRSRAGVPAPGFRHLRGYPVPNRSRRVAPDPGAHRRGGGRRHRTSQ